MSLKDDIEALNHLIKTWELDEASEIEARNNARKALSRIESALALDDGPPREGDAVAYAWDDGYIRTSIFSKDSSTTPVPVLLMRSDEIERRIKEAGK